MRQFGNTNNRITISLIKDIFLIDVIFKFEAKILSKFSKTAVTEFSQENDLRSFKKPSNMKASEIPFPNNKCSYFSKSIFPAGRSPREEFFKAETVLISPKLKTTLLLDCPEISKFCDSLSI